MLVSCISDDSSQTDKAIVILKIENRRLFLLIVDLHIFPEFAGLKVLVLDDEPELATLCSSQLAKYGFSIYSAGNGNKAVSKFIEERPEIVVVKYELPKRNGLEVVKEMLAIMPSTKILMFSSDKDSLQQAEGIGVEILLLSPFPLERLIRSILALSKTRLPVARIHR